MKIKFLIPVVAGLAFAACNSKSEKENSGDSAIVTDSITNTADSIGTDTIDHSGNLKDTTGSNNGTTYTDSI